MISCERYSSGTLINYVVNTNKALYSLILMYLINQKGNLEFLKPD